MRRAFRLSLAALLLLPVAATAKAGCPAEPFVQSAGAAMMGAARKRSPAAFSGVASRYTDLHAIAIFALGQHRSSLSKAKEAEYVALTRGFVGRFMAKYADRFDGRGMSVTECTASGKAVTVAAKLSGGQKVVFKLNRTRSGYKVRDLNVSSVWLAQQLRSTFVGVIRRNGGDVAALFRYLRDYS